MRVHPVLEHEIHKLYQEDTIPHHDTHQGYKTDTTEYHREGSLEDTDTQQHTENTHHDLGHDDQCTAQGVELQDEDQEDQGYGCQTGAAQEAHGLCLVFLLPAHHNADACRRFKVV